MIVAAAALLLPHVTPFREQLWRDPRRPGAVVYAVSCDPRHDVDEHCSRFQIGDDPRFIPQGGGYLAREFGGVSVIWTRRPGEGGPDVVVLGDPGGSGGCMDLVAVSFERSPQFELKTVCVSSHPHAEHTASGPRIVMTERHGAGVVSLVWSNGEFVPDWNASRRH